MNEGYQPKSNVEDIKIIPKKRYEFMDKYLSNTGKCAHNMMRGSASIQVSIDYFSKEDCYKKMKVASLLTPIFQLMMDNTYSNKEVKEIFYLRRAYIWDNVDKDRCGIVPNILNDDFSFESYSSYISKIPLIVKEDENKYLYVGNDSAKSIYVNDVITDGILNHITGMIFFDVRLRKYIEIRGVDSTSEDLMLSYVAFIKSIMYSKKFLDKCIKFIKNNNINENDVYRCRCDLIKNGYDTIIYGYKVTEIIDKLLDISEKELDDNEKHYLNPLKHKNSLQGRVIYEYKVLTEKNMNECNERKKDIIDDKIHSPLTYIKDVKKLTMFSGVIF